ncbi:MAG: DUF1287 domain-containing protein [Chloroflexota bacterium]
MKVNKGVKLLLIYLFSLIAAVIIAITYIYLFHTYKEDEPDNDKDKDGIVNSIDPDTDGDGIPNFRDPDADGDGVPNAQDIAENARKLKGTFYEYFKGLYENIGGKAGFLVCYDVPRIAYRKAGLSLDVLLREDYAKNKDNYNPEKGINLPNTDYFFRRTRNLYAYCEGNGKLIKNCLKPRPGDVLFYGRYHITLVIEVNPDGTINEVESAPETIFITEHKNKKWRPMDVGRLL